jgi:hypothetical protein
MLVPPTKAKWVQAGVHHVCSLRTTGKREPCCFPDFADLYLYVVCLAANHGIHPATIKSGAPCWLMNQSRGEKNGNSTTIVLNLIRSTVLQYLNLHRDLPIFPANTCGNSTSPSLQVRDGRVTRIAWFHGDGEQDSDPRPTRRSTAGVN